jgi:DNA-directed RNA polymerase subunit beta
MHREVVNAQYELDRRPEEDVDFEFMSPNQFVGPNVGLIPLQNAVQPTRLFYGARFANQAQPLVKPEAPWIQTSMDDTPDTSFDDMLGGTAGAIRSDGDATVEDVADTQIKLRLADGTPKVIGLYRNMPFNRYSGITQTPTVTKGQTVKAKDLLARSNFTDEKGSLALGLNARVGVVPFKGFSMDDAMVVSDKFAKRATSLHLDSIDKDFSGGNLKSGQDHFKSLFPDMYTKDQLTLLDEHGIVRPGQVVQPGDPLILATRPRNFNSAQSQSLGRLGKVARQLRADASVQWDSAVPGTVTDVVRKNDGSVKVLVESHRPMQKGDKLVLRSGQKGIVSAVIPEHEMLRTASGEPLEMLLNQQGLPSRANPSLLLEILLGKVAAKSGTPMKLPAFNPNEDSWIDFVAAKLKEAGMTDKETVFDPKDNRKLDRPITTGNAYVLKLHHIAEHKYDARGQGGYDQDGQPSKGSGLGGGAKRRSGLETTVMLSSGAYNNLRESSTLTGQQNDDFWRTFRSGQTPKAPGSPFVFQKFRALLNGAGMHAREMGGGKLRLGLLTDKQLEQFKPLKVHSGETIDFRTLAPKAGGLFDPALVANKNWGYIDLPEPMPNPAAEDTIRQLLGITRKDFEEVLAGTRPL